MYILCICNIHRVNTCIHICLHAHKHMHLYISLRVSYSYRYMICAAVTLTHHVTLANEKFHNHKYVILHKIKQRVSKMHKIPCKMQVSFYKRATNRRALLRKTIYGDQAFCVFATVYTWTCLWVWHDSQGSAINIHTCFACVTCPIYGWLTYQNPCTSLEGICNDIYMCTCMFM